MPNSIGSQFRQDLVPGPDPAPTARRSTIVPFRALTRIGNRLTARDRIAALSWAEQVELHGYARIVIDTAGELSGHEPGDFMLIYPRDAVWARWGIGCGSQGLTLWHAASGATMGTFATMDQALAAVPPCEAKPPRPAAALPIC